MLVISCDRFHWGSYERGPINFLVEYHNYVTPPEKCRSDSRLAWVLSQLIVSDAELAQNLTASEGMPATYEPITIATDDLFGARHVYAVWGNSKLELFQEALDNSPAALGEPVGLFWSNAEGGITGMEFDSMPLEGPTYPSERLALGSLEPPLLAASLGETYAAPGYQFYQGNFGGPIIRYSDALCEQPA